MTDVPTAAEIEALRDIDTPTICNLLEMVVPERRGYGYTVQHLHCLYPDMKPSSASPRRRPCAPRTRRAGLRRSTWISAPATSTIWRRARAPKISVVQDIDERPGYGAFWGEVFSAVHKALGCRGVVTNGSAATSTCWRPSFRCSAA